MLLPKKHLGGNYVHQLQRTIEYVKSKTYEIIQRFPNFTLHDLQHSQCVANNLHRLCEPLKLDQRSHFCLLSASFCHDLGMANVKASQHLYWIKRSEARRKHARFSAEAVMSDLPSDCIKDELLRYVIARICEGHGRSDWVHSDFNAIEGINVRLLAALLSLADALDLRSERRNPKDIDTIEQLMKYPFLSEDEWESPEIQQNPELADLSRLHWLRHYYSIQPSIGIAFPGSQTIQINLLASVGIERDAVGAPKHNMYGHDVVDISLPIIEELIQSDILSLVDSTNFKQAISGHLHIEFAKPNPDKDSFFKIMPHYSKMLFPRALLKTAFAGKLIRPLALPLEKADKYYATRIEPYVCLDDFQVSITWRPASLSPDALVRKMYQKERVAAIQSVKDLAKEQWDFVLWLVEVYVRYMDEEVIRKGHLDETFERLKVLIAVPGLVQDGDLLRIFIAEDGIHTPVTATQHVAKQGSYEGTYPSRDNFLCGRIERCNHEQRAIFRRLSRRVADKLGITCRDEILMSKLLEYCNPQIGYVQALKTIHYIFHSLAIKVDLMDLESGLKDLILHGRAILKANIAMHTEWENQFLGKEHTTPRLDIALPKDIGEILSIEKGSFTHPWEHDQSFLEPANELKGFVMRISKKVIGYLILDYDSHHTTIVKMAINGNYRRSTFGTYMVRWAKQFCYEIGNKRICLRVRESNVGAIDFYKHINFRVTTKLEGYYKTTGKEAAYEMELML